MELNVISINYIAVSNNLIGSLDLGPLFNRGAPKE